MVWYFASKCQQWEGAACLAAVRGNNGALLSLTDLSLAIWKNISSSLLLAKSKNFAFPVLPVTGLFSHTLNGKVSSLEFISPGCEAFSPGFVWSAGLSVWTGSVVRCRVHLVTGVYTNGYTVMMGLLKPTFLCNISRFLVTYKGEK